MKYFVDNDRYFKWIYEDDSRAGVEVRYPTNDIYAKLDAVLKPEQITEIEISSNIRRLLDWQCYDLTNIKEINFPENIHDIGVGCFTNCSSVEQVIFTGKIKTIQNNAFENCASLKSIELTDSLTDLGAEVFLGCVSLEKVKLSQNITKINAGVFRDQVYCKIVPSSMRSFFPLPLPVLE